MCKYIGSRLQAEPGPGGCWRVEPADAAGDGAQRVGCRVGVASPGLVTHSVRLGAHLQALARAVESPHQLSEGAFHLVRVSSLQAGPLFSPATLISISCSTHGTATMLHDQRSRKGGRLLLFQIPYALFLYICVCLTVTVTTVLFAVFVFFCFRFLNILLILKYNYSKLSKSIFGVCNSEGFDFERECGGGMGEF